MEKINYTKEYKELYLPKTKPGIVNVPKIKFVMVRGEGNPNAEKGDYKESLKILYGIVYTIKMSKMGDTKIPGYGYHDFVVPPLEGLWWTDRKDFKSKDEFKFFSMIRLPDFVTKDIFNWACDELQKKKGIDISKAEFLEFEEGKCVQILHKGPYDNEKMSFDLIYEFMKENNLEFNSAAVSELAKLKYWHHEIYLSDPRRSKPENNKTVLRLPVK